MDNITNKEQECKYSFDNCATTFLRELKDDFTNNISKIGSYHNFSEYDIDFTTLAIENIFNSIIAFYDNSKNKAYKKQIIFAMINELKELYINDFSSLTPAECDSSIEGLLYTSLIITAPKNWNDNYYIDVQVPVCNGKYKIDMIIYKRDPHFSSKFDENGIPILAIECDGYNYHYNTPSKAQHSLNRINEIKMTENIEIFQYTCSEIYSNCITIARDIWNYITDKFQGCSNGKSNVSNEIEVQTDNGLNDRRKPKKPIKCMTNEEVSAHYKLSNNSRILTNAELKFYQNILSSFCDDLQLIPLMKVRVNDIIDINEADSREDYHYRLNVAMLHFDFVIVKPESTEIVCVIELDDSSHQKEWTNDDDKNKLCQILNIPLLRVSTCPEQNIKCIEIYNSSCTKESKHSSIAVSYANVKAPVCKKCGSEMTETPNKKQGVIYWNCPKCCKENDFSNGSFYIYV